MTELQSFQQLYGQEIQKFISKIYGQLRSICSNVKYEILLQERGSSISFDNGVVTLNIGFESIMELFNSSSLSILECFFKIVTHEYLHWLLGHLSDEITKQQMILVTCQGGFRKLFHKGGSCLFHNDGSFDSDHCVRKIQNIAGDFEINRLINIDSPFLRAKNFGLPDSLYTAEYYSIIYHVLNSLPVGVIDDDDFKSSGVTNYISEQFIGSRDALLKLYLSDDGMNGNDVKSIDSCAINNVNKVQKLRNKAEFENLQGNIGDFLIKMNTANTGVWKEFNDILNSMLVDPTVRLSFVDKKDTWTKFNNRKDGDGMLHPGRMDKFGTINRKMAMHHVIFVDISASMTDMVNVIFAFCYYAIERMNIIRDSRPSDAFPTAS